MVPLVHLDLELIKMEIILSIDGATCWVSADINILNVTFFRLLSQQYPFGLVVPSVTLDGALPVLKEMVHRTHSSSLLHLI